MYCRKPGVGSHTQNNAIQTQQTNLIIWKTSWKIFGSITETVHLTEIICSGLLFVGKIRGSLLAWDRISLLRFTVYLPQVLQTNATILGHRAFKTQNSNTSCRVSQSSLTDVVSLSHLDTCINSEVSRLFR